MVKAPPPESLARVVKLVVLVVLGYALVHSFLSSPSRAPASANASKPKDCGNTTGNGLTNFALIAAPLLNDVPPSVQIEDTKTGAGQTAYCGQRARLRYSYASPKGDIIFSNLEAGKAPETVVIGGGDMLRGFEQGLPGMKEGGERTIAIPAPLAFPASKDPHALRDSAAFRFPKTLSTVIAKAALISVAPKVPTSDMPLRAIDVVYAGGGSMHCGDTVNADLTVWGIDGSKLFSTDGKPISFTLGRSQVPFGIEQGIMGMTIGGQRTLILPPVYGKPLDATAASALPANFALPEKAIVLVEISLRPAVKEMAAPAGKPQASKAPAQP